MAKSHLGRGAGGSYEDWREGRDELGCGRELAIPGLEEAGSGVDLDSGEN